jgi:hypothetical protein
MAHPDLDQILNALISFAQQMLTKRGEFYAFSFSMGLDGKIIPNVEYNGDEHPLSQQIIDLITHTFRNSVINGEIRAAGICFDVRVIPPGQSNKTDAICAGLEHINGDAIDVYLPYKKGWLGKVTYGELFATSRTPQFFIKQQRTG